MNTVMTLEAAARRAPRERLVRAPGAEAAKDAARRTDEEIQILEHERTFSDRWEW